MNKFTAIAGLLLAASTVSAQAAGTINDRALVPATSQVFDFQAEDGLIIGLGGSYSFGAGSFAADQQFTVGQYIADLGENGAWGAGNRFLSFDHIGAMTLDISFIGATRGFAFDYNAWQELGSSTPASISISYFDGGNNLIGSHTEVISPALGWDSYDQFRTTGYVADSASIARVSISGDGVVLDNLTYTNPVPEPETYALMLAGLGLLGLAARRRKNAA